MARQIRKKLTLIFLAIASAGIGLARAAPPAGILVQYSFDEEKLESGPDTFSVFQNSKGTVSLSRRFPLSGLYSVEIEDVPGDRDFPELQGYFALRSTGKLFAHFSLLVTNPNEILNIALAGPTGFVVKKDGIAFWLHSENGFLYHHSDSMPQKLFQMKPFVWYSVNLEYDISKGTYDLTISEERVSKPIVSLLDQPNASHQVGSSVNKFSFVGDVVEDESRVVYYVDDVVIGTDEKIFQLPMLAPGRRKLFRDYFLETRAEMLNGISCLHAEHYQEFDINEGDLKRFKEYGYLDELELGMGGKLKKVPQTARNEARLEALVLWGLGCRSLENREYAPALVQFKKAYELAPRGRMYEVSRILALAALQKWKEVDSESVALERQWGGDPRYGLIVGMLAQARGDLDRAESELKRILENPQLEAAAFPSGDAANRYFYVLLFNSRWRNALVLATEMLDHPLTPKEKLDWLEMAGDAAFFSEDLGKAKMYYEQASSAEGSWPLLKLADIAFLEKDFTKERKFREKIYGALRAK